MQKIDDFRFTCETLIGSLSPLVNLNFTLQTNGMLISDRWIDAFYDYNVKVGVSIDGPEEYNDIHRVDFKGNGTHKRVVEGVRRALESSKMQSLGGIGSLSVINPGNSAEKIYNHLIHEIGFKTLDFLLLDSTHDNTPPYPPEKYGEFLITLFDCWIKDNNPEISIRFLKSSLALFFGKGSLIYGVGPVTFRHHPLVCIRNNGDLSPTDELMATDRRVVSTGCNVNNTSLFDFLKAPIFEEILSAQSHLPEKCKSCCWENVCGGGGIVHRFKRENGFNNPSVYCDGLSNFYTHVVSYLIKSGWPVQDIYDVLFETTNTKVSLSPTVENSAAREVRVC